jgi:hypothetical protein
MKNSVSIENKNTPKVWQELWNEMKNQPSQWVETTEEMYFEMLGCLPPIRQKGGFFMVGEPTRHNAKGEAVYAAFNETDGRFYAKYLTLSEFN